MMHAVSILADQANYGIGGGQIYGQGFGLVFAILTVIGLWATFRKAGRPGWAAIIPIYNLYTMIKITGRSGWWLLLFLIPLVNIVLYIVIVLDLAAAFRKGALFGIFGLWLFPFIGFMMLGFGKAKFEGTPLF
ncbi:hypothetical protein KPL76_01780 [Subtercola sp. PAMC28395]|uniref:DUF5684 domain-containing protein n=1 Tax=Subtercola sp. PAMC28395 TaxID=2846775 RepID=UPI001C0BBEAF|nr:DUF5684 domain-containing protein [Subtercola sp. PAMC28395]QWT24188.1 hypothetical protein KPL76_01780 [Subtercola sp. PAMC28395]